MRLCSFGNLTVFKTLANVDILEIGTNPSFRPKPSAPTSDNFNKMSIFLNPGPSGRSHTGGGTERCQTLQKFRVHLDVKLLGGFFQTRFYHKILKNVWTVSNLLQLILHLDGLWIGGIVRNLNGDLWSSSKTEAAVRVFLYIWVTCCWRGPGHRLEA